MRYRTKPFEIEAVQFTGSNWDELKAFAAPNIDGPLTKEDKVDDPEMAGAVYDKLHSTWVSFYDGQWIIKGMKGEFYPCDPEVFASKYEEIQ